MLSLLPRNQGADVAIKLATSPGGVDKSCLREALISPQLRHPNVVHTYTVRGAMLTAEFLEEIARRATQSSGSTVSRAAPSHARSLPYAPSGQLGTIHEPAALMSASGASIEAGEGPLGAKPCGDGTGGPSSVGAPTGLGAGAGAVGNGGVGGGGPDAPSLPLPHQASGMPAIAGFWPPQPPAESAAASSSTLLWAAPSEDGLGDPRKIRSELEGWPDVLMRVGAAPGKYLLVLVQEFCNQGTLSHAIKRGQFTAQEGVRSELLGRRMLLRSAAEVCRGMINIHTANVIHGDLKPSNVLLAPSRTDRRGFVAKIADFGLVHLLPRGNSKVDSGTWGTPAYAAPEVINGTHAKSSDVYAFGIVLYEMLTRQKPYEGLNPAQIMIGVSFHGLRPDWPDAQWPELAALARRCCAHEPHDRPTFRELEEEMVCMEEALREESRRLSRECTAALSPSASVSASAGLAQPPASTNAAAAAAAAASQLGPASLMASNPDLIFAPSGPNSRTPTAPGYAPPSHPGAPSLLHLPGLLYVPIVGGMPPQPLATPAPPSGPGGLANDDAQAAGTSGDGPQPSTGPPAPGLVPQPRPQEPDAQQAVRPGAKMRPATAPAAGASGPAALGTAAAGGGGAAVSQGGATPEGNHVGAGARPGGRRRGPPTDPELSLSFDQVDRGSAGAAKGEAVSPWTPTAWAEVMTLVEATPGLPQAPEETVDD
ncbi:hypothetical protein HYH03_016592 [Edaphochlamys debaryana]|uniref:Protein kinase domain-containing protein n=1 Tax=Edaphochlamys debaryana TaxID=47281 RepID=A0A835XRA5_9CHLO|nr:hypothetical protein HYH03_016592 [Edaphochlamys debaryana]|eukprot:KAG2484639.1 hypothetical protein HYH03_016592 [Edaphochlamys debaryana]